jgi:hypothetical protein
MASRTAIVSCLRISGDPLGGEVTLDAVVKAQTGLSIEDISRALNHLKSCIYELEQPKKG